MGINFPNPQDALVFYPPDGGPAYFWRNDHWARYTGTAMSWNRVINPCMLSSLQNGSAGSAATGAIDYYAADQWWVRSSLTGGGTLVAARWDGQNTNNGSKTVYTSPVVAQASLTAGEYLLITQKIEGNRIADLKWGTTDAIDVVLRLTALWNGGPGTFSARITNGASARSYVAPFTLGSGWTDVVIPIPGDTLGTWPTDTSVGMWVDIVPAIGSTYQTPNANVWQAGNLYATPGQTNGMSIGGSGPGNFHLSAVGLYADPYKTRKAPPFQMTKIEEDIRDSQRYWYRAFALRGVVTAATTIRCGTMHPVGLRAAPGTPAMAVVGAIRGYDSAVIANVSSVANAGNSTSHLDIISTHTGGTFTAGRPGLLLTDGAETLYIAVNVRM
jgi:hypothetical protein